MPLTFVGRDTKNGSIDTSEEEDVVEMHSRGSRLMGLGINESAFMDYPNNAQVGASIMNYSDMEFTAKINDSFNSM